MCRLLRERHLLELDLAQPRLRHRQHVARAIQREVHHRVIDQPALRRVITNPILRAPVKHSARRPRPDAVHRRREAGDVRDWQPRLPRQGLAARGEIERVESATRSHHHLARAKAKAGEVGATVKRFPSFTAQTMHGAFTHQEQFVAPGVRTGLRARHGPGKLSQFPGTL